MATRAEPCFHCGLPMPAGCDLTVSVDGVDQPVCCPGCAAVAQLVMDCGLDSFYSYRAGPAGARPPETEPDRWNVFDRDAALRNLSVAQGDRREAVLQVEGIYCTACAWLIERSLERVEGLDEIAVNPASGRVRLVWQPAVGRFSTFLREIARLGYTPHPVGAASRSPVWERERRQALKRLLVAGLGMMQVMMFAVGLYAGAFQGMHADYESYLRLVSLLVATPVVFYAGRPFFTGALRALRARGLSMDVPVALAIGGAYLASIWNAFLGGGEVYFDSVTMFVFFLSLGRFLEMSARHRASERVHGLVDQLPATATRLSGADRESVLTAELSPGDIVIVGPGDAVPADGELLDGAGDVDESMLTGESVPVRKHPGECVLAGSVNRGGVIRMRIAQVGEETTLAAVGRLLNRAQSERPRLARLADRVAARFVGAVLVLAVIVAAYWWRIDPDQAFRITLSVLVITCPCALSLATPAAIAAATNRLAREGLLVTSASALETLAQVDEVVFDKTGTLTVGEPSIEQAIPLRASVAEFDADHWLAVAAALEADSTHPVANAFRVTPPAGAVGDVRQVAGEGVEASAEATTLRLGRQSFVFALSGTPMAEHPDVTSTWVYLGDAAGPIAAYGLGDQPRAGAADVVAMLEARGIATSIASGDRTSVAAALAGRLGIANFEGELSPGDKLARIRTRQDGGAVVAMVGDGINDGPVLAGANVSVALGSGTALAQHSAGAVLLGSSLRPLAEGLDIARRMRRIVRQNLTWAVAYNATALPLAAMGLVAPWMAAIGMSASSLIVVLNALRLTRRDAPERSRSPVSASVAAPAGQARA